MQRYPAIIVSSILFFAVAGTCAWGGGVDTWGNNADGELGDGNPGYLNIRSAPYAIPSLSNGVTVVAAGGDFSLAVQNGQAYAWGYNGDGQLGTGNTTSQSTPVALTGPLSSGVTAIAAGDSHGLAVNSGGVYAWGYNYYGQVGNGTTTASQMTPVLVLSGTIAAIAAGGNHSLAIKGGQVYAWGSDSNGQLGDGNSGVGIYQSTPVAITSSNLTSVTAIAAGTSFSLALNNGAVWAWGYNYEGELGNNSTVNSSTPVAVTSLTSGVTSIAAGNGHALAVQNGAVFAWGDNGFGQLGNGTTSFGSTTPVQVPGLTNIKQVAAGAESSYALASDGSLWVWGDNSWGQLGLGDNSTTYYLSPTHLLAATGFVFTSIDSDANGDHVVALATPTTISTGITVQLTAGNMLPTTIGLTVNGGTFDLKGFSQQLNSLSDGGVNTGSVTNSGLTASTLTLSPASPASTTFGGTISGNLALIMATAGTVILTGANTYTGATNVNQGQLNLSTGSLAGTPITVGTATTNAVLTVQGNYTMGGTNAGTLTLAGGNGASTGRGTLNMVDGAINTLTLSNSSATQTALNIGGTAGNPSVLNLELGAAADRITVSTAKINIGAGFAIINLTGLGGLSGSTQTIISAAGGVASGSQTFAQFAAGATLNTSGNFGGYAVALGSNSGSLTLTETANPTPATAYWNGDIDANWNSFNGGNINNTNWTTDAAGTSDPHQIPGATTTVIFTTNTASYLITTLAQNFSIAGLSFLGSPTSATNPVTLTGSNTLTLGSGGITVSAGSGAHVISTGAVVLGAAQSWTNNSGSLLNINAPVSGAYTLTLAGAGNFSLGGNIATGAGGLVKSGNGIVSLSGTNTYTGATNVTAGTLNIQNATALGTTAAGTTVTNGATLQLQNNINVGAEALSLGGAGYSGQTGALVNVSGNNTYGGLITLTTAATISSDSGILALTNNISGAGLALTLNGSGNGIVSGVITTGSGAVTKTGTGTWTLTGANNYSGSTTISLGTLQIGNNGSTGSLGSGAVSNNGALVFNLYTTVNVPNLITGFGSLTQAGSGTTTLTSAASYSGPTSISAGMLAFGGGVTHNIGVVSGAGALQVNASTTLNSQAINVGSLIVNGTQVFQTSSGVSTVTNLTLAGSGPSNWTGLLDLTNNPLIVHNGGNVASQIKQAQNGGLWNGTAGITSSTVVASLSTTAKLALGYASGTEYTALNSGSTTFADQPIIATDELIKPTLAGDASLDGTVNFSDFLAMLGSYNHAGDWTQGDFNGDGVVNFTDFLAMLGNYNHSYSPSPIVTAQAPRLSPAMGLAPSVVPEPASLALLGLGAVGPLGRWRRKRCDTPSAIDHSR